MAWFPIGPDFVFGPRSTPWRRLSRRNEVGRQGLVSCIAIDPTDSNTIYVIVRPFTGGASAFRTRDGGMSWEPISDWLRRTRRGLDPTWIAVHPLQPARIYLASGGENAVYVSDARGDLGSWSGPNNVGASPLKLIVDPRGATDPATTTLYAACWRSGLHRSTNGGVTWPRVLTADPTSFVAHMPATGTANFYVGSWAQGLWHTTTPTQDSDWTNLCTQGIGLPPPNPGVEEGNYWLVSVDLCPRNPSRVYCWFARGDRTTGLYTTSSSTVDWDTVPSTTLPNPQWGLYVKTFSVAPNSPGDGTNDILFYGNMGVRRSTDGGLTWRDDAVGFHADIHSFAYVPPAPAPGVIPVTYLGCDGGIARSLHAADPSRPFDTAPAHANQLDAYDANLGGWINMNHGFDSIAVLGHASDPAAAAIAFAGCQDTGVASGARALGWKSNLDADVYTIAAASTAQGMTFWINYGMYQQWPVFRITRLTDRTAGQTSAWVLFGSSPCASTSNFAVDADKRLLAGTVVRDGSRTVAASTPTGAQTVTPSDMTGIHVGSMVVIEPGGNEEVVRVTATTATTFDATFARDHPAGSILLLERAFVSRSGSDDVARQISQDFGDDGRRVGLVAVHPTNPDVLYCATVDPAGTDRWRVWTTTAATTATAATTWTEIATGRPAAGSQILSSLAVDAGGVLFALWQRPVPATLGSALYRLDGGIWVAEITTGTPDTALGKLVADPVRAGVLYVGSGTTVHRLERGVAGWTWTDVGADLPGAPVYDVWTGNVGTAAQPKVMLRAAVTTRGVFENDVTAGASDPPVALYLRDHLLDHALLPRTVEGLPDPYAPTDPAATLWHYMCADVKVDLQAAGGYLQTQPEGANPLSNVHFDMLRDDSRSLTQSTTARVHVQIHNRSNTALAGVKVWAIYCRASAGVPALSASASSGNAFPFWDQFRSNGDIVPSLPGDSPWTAVGPPQTIGAVDAAHPRVASFPWTVPTLTSGTTGHYCIAVFVHSASSPVGETTDMSVDSITPRNRQVGQKNLHVVATPLGPGPGPGGGGGGEGGGPATALVEEYVEFHNPTQDPRTASLVFDLRDVPPEATARLRFTSVDVAGGAGTSFPGVATTRRLSPLHDLLAPFRRAGRALLEALRGPNPIWNVLKVIASLVVGLLQSLFGGGRKKAHRLPRFEPFVHELEPSPLATLEEVRIPGFSRVGALVEFEARLDQPARFHVQQVVGEEVVGGSLYIVQVEPPKKPKRDPIEDDRIEEEGADDIDLLELERYGDRWRYIPPWIRSAREGRRDEQGRNRSDKRGQAFNNEGADDSERERGPD